VSRRLLVAIVLATASCAPGESEWVETTEVSAPETPSPEPPDTASGLPLTSVTGLATSDRGLVVAGISDDEALFWDAWLVPRDGGSPVRLAPVGNRLVAVDASGALWATITELGDETRLSPSDGSPSVLLSPELPPGFSAERAVADGEGGWLLAGAESIDGATRGAVYAVDSRGRASCLARDPHAESPIFLDAALDGDTLTLIVQHEAEGPATLARIPRR
jgi:hypothetical protein